MQEVDYLAMSDEEWLKAMPPAPVPVAEQPQDTHEKEDDDSEAKAPDAATSDEPQGESEAADEGAGAEASADDEEDTAAGADTEADEAAADAAPAKKAVTAESDDDGEDADAEAPTQKPDAEAIDYKAVYEKLTRPFKANGKEIQVRDVDDAIALMQMGANYNKKMAALKPNLKLLKLLETHDLLSEEKLSFLIDVQKKNPAALSKLIKESGVDPLELDDSKAAEYKPTTRKIDDREIELDQVLEEIQGSAEYDRTLTVVSKEWDVASRQIIADQPQLLKVINAHMESGIYDLIQKELEHEKMMGRLSGLSDIEAYRKIGDAIQARGGFDHLGRQVKTAPAAKPITPPSKPKSEAVVQKVKDRKRAASTTAASAPKPAATAYNPLAMSDEEFSKLVKPAFL